MRALAPHWGALLALALFLVVGLAVLDDYGVTVDEGGNALRAARVWAFLAGANDSFDLEDFSIRIYGPSFELAQLFAERALGIEGGRGVHLAQHLLLHLAFLAGGLFAYFLARRLSGNSLVGLFAMAIFLLHPRLYAHSFFNGKDIAFGVAFIIALHLAHRAFRRETVAAFVLLGVGVGIAVNLRIMGVVLLAAIPALRALDFAFSSGWAERKRILVTAGTFVLAAGLVFFALLPYLWADPIGRAVEWWATLSDHPLVDSPPFRGEAYLSTDFPPEYLPVWFTISSPPFALPLGAIGATAVLAGAVKARALRNTRRRFGLLALGCIVAPVLGLIALDANVYTGWRQFFFLWAPFSLLAAYGLSRLVSSLRRARLRAAAYLAAGAGLAATLASMALIHPNQQEFFNFSVDRVTPEYLRTQYEVNYWDHPTRQALEWLSDNIDSLPGETAGITGKRHWEVGSNARILPDAARARINEIKKSAPIRILRWSGSWARSALELHRAQVYNNTIFIIEHRDDLQAVYAATLAREPEIVAAYDIHFLDGAVALVMEPCAPAFIESVSVTLRATPVDSHDLPPRREGTRGERRGFFLAEYGAFFDGNCVASLPLPDYPIADIEFFWIPELLTREAARAATLRAKANGRLLARSAYDLYLADNELVYVQERCDPLETEHPFRVSVFSEIVDDSPETAGWGREIHEFEFHERGALLEDGACVALFPLPGYPIAAVRTGQYMDGEAIWEAAFSVNPERYATVYHAVEGSEPLARGAFDVHLLDGGLAYVKEPCAKADTDARFFLHVVPERVGDLPEERRESGFDNLDFRFFLNGAWFDERCAARVLLPDYPIASVRTGQFVSGEGEIWSAGFAVGR